MTVFIEPDRTQYPEGFNAIKCVGLEALTGVDMVISSLPPNPLTKQVASPIDNLQSHINARSLFVQIKIGYDICSFDQLHSSISRIQACKIPKGQAILLPIGEYKADKNGLLVCRGKNGKWQEAFGTTKYETLGTIYDMWEMRGGTVEAFPPKTIDDLQAWIDRKRKSLKKIEKEGTRNIYPPKPEFILEDIWQSINEIKDVRKFLVCGLDDFGAKTAQSVFDYADKRNPEAKYNLYYILSLITDEDEKGKPLHKIPLIGNGTRKNVRGMLGLCDGWNLSGLAYNLAFYQGWQSFGNEFARLVNDRKMSPQKVHQKLMKEKENVLTDLESQIPF